jgi:hypothetical protein
MNERDTNSYPGGTPGVGVTAGSNLIHPANAKAFQQMVEASQKMSKSGQAIKSAFTGSEKISEGMNKSFQGMQAKAGVIQKIVSTAFDVMAIGTSKMKKDIVGAVKKGVVEGDIPAMIQGMLDAFTQYIDMSGMDKAWQMAFKPFSVMISAIGSRAAAIVAASDAFRNMMNWISSPAGQDAINNFAQQIATAMERFGMMDIDLLMDFIEFIVDEITRLADFIHDVKASVPNREVFEVIGDSGRSSGGGGTTTPNTPGGGYFTSNVTVNASGVVTDSAMRVALNTAYRKAALWGNI